jgi:hypothetical protein
MMNSSEQWSAEELCKTLNDTAATDKDTLAAIDGATGSGKSTLAIKLCKKGCEWFDMDKDILYSRKEIMDWVTEAKNGSWGIADEAVNALFKRDFASKDQKFLLKIIDMCRSKNLTLFLCIPNFWALDNHLLQGRIRLRLHVAKTGLCFMWKPTGNPFTPDKWCRKYNEKVCYNWDHYPNAKRTKGFIGYINFGDLGSAEREQYVQIKERKKKEIKEQEEMAEKEEDVQKKRSVELGKWLMIDWLYSKGLLKLGWERALAELDGVTHQAISARLKDFRAKGIYLTPQPKKSKDNNSYINTPNSTVIDASPEGEGP